MMPDAPCLPEDTPHDRVSKNAVAAAGRVCRKCVYVDDCKAQAEDITAYLGASEPITVGGLQIQATEADILLAQAKEPTFRFTPPRVSPPTEEPQYFRVLYRSQGEDRRPLNDTERDLLPLAMRTEDKESPFTPEERTKVYETVTSVISNGNGLPVSDVNKVAENILKDAVAYMGQGMEREHAIERALRFPFTSGETRSTQAFNSTSRINSRGRQRSKNRAEPEIILTDKEMDSLAEKLNAELLARTSIVLKASLAAQVGLDITRGYPHSSFPEMVAILQSVEQLFTQRVLAVDEATGKLSLSSKLESLSSRERELLVQLHKLSGILGEATSPELSVTQSEETELQGKVADLLQEQLPDDPSEALTMLRETSVGRRLASKISRKYLVTSMANDYIAKSNYELDESGEEVILRLASCLYAHGEHSGATIEEQSQQLHKLAPELLKELLQVRTFNLSIKDLGRLTMHYGFAYVAACFAESEDNPYVSRSDVLRVFARGGDPLSKLRAMPEALLQLASTAGGPERISLTARKYALHSADPERTLELCGQHIVDLGKKYARDKFVSPSIIRLYCFTQAETAPVAIDRFRERCAMVAPEFHSAEVTDRVVAYFCRHFSDPEKIMTGIMEYQTKFAQLRDQVCTTESEVDEDLLLIIAEHSPNEVRWGVESFYKRYRMLQESIGEKIEPQIIKEVVARCPRRTLPELRRMAFGYQRAILSLDSGNHRTSWPSLHPDLHAVDPANELVEEETTQERIRQIIPLLSSLTEEERQAVALAYGVDGLIESQEGLTEDELKRFFTTDNLVAYVNQTILPKISKRLTES